MEINLTPEQRDVVRYAVEKRGELYRKLAERIGNPSDLLKQVTP